MAKKPIPVQLSEAKLMEILNSPASDFKKGKKFLQYLRQDGARGYITAPPGTFERRLVDWLVHKGWLMPMPESIGFANVFSITPTGQKVDLDYVLMHGGDDDDDDTDGDPRDDDGP